MHVAKYHWHLPHAPRQTKEGETVRVEMNKQNRRETQSGYTHQSTNGSCHALSDRQKCDEVEWRVCLIKKCRLKSSDGSVWGVRVT
jgi:hypothetical protein